MNWVLVGGVAVAAGLAMTGLIGLGPRPRANAQAASDGRAVEHITSQEAADRVSKCGLGAVTVEVRHTDWGEDDEVLVAKSATGATDEQLQCADRATSYYQLELPPTLQTRYDAIRDRRVSAELLAESRERLSARGLLDRVPRYERGITDDAAFTRAVEELCGPKASGAFGSKFGVHAISPDWVLRELKPPNYGSELLGCILDVTRVAGYEVHFIGNMGAVKER